MLKNFVANKIFHQIHVKVKMTWLCIIYNYRLSKHLIVLTIEDHNLFHLGASGVVQFFLTECYHSWDSPGRHVHILTFSVNDTF